MGGAQDPLTPVDQKFATFKDLKEHYQIFINKSKHNSIGGSGAGFIKDLDDVTFDESTGENKLLIYNGSKWVGIARPLSVVVVVVLVLMEVSIPQVLLLLLLSYRFTGIAATFSGNVSVSGTLTYQDAKHIDAIGIITAQQGIQILNNGLNITSGIATIVRASTAQQL